MNAMVNIHEAKTNFSKLVDRAHGGVARGWKALMGGAPVQRAIEALDEVVGQADTDDP